MAELKKTCPFCGTFPTEKVEVDTGGFTWIHFSVICTNCGIRKSASVKVDSKPTFMDIERAMDRAIANWEQRKG